MVSEVTAVAGMFLADSVVFHGWDAANKQDKINA